MIFFFCQFGRIGLQALKLKKSGVLGGKLVVCFRAGHDVGKAFLENSHMYDELFKAVDLCLPVCEHFKQTLIHYGCPPDKIMVHYSAIDLSKFVFRPRTGVMQDGIIKIIGVGRLVPYKGFDNAIRAIGQLVKLYPNIIYEIIGEGPHRKVLKALIKKEKLSHNVVLLGYMSQEDVIKKLDQADIFFLTPFTTKVGQEEGIPNVLKEAMAMGLPVVATQHAGIPELVQDGVSGLLVPEKDVAQMIEKIIFLIQNPKIFTAIGKKGARHIKKYFNKDTVNEKL